MNKNLAFIIQALTFLIAIVYALWIFYTASYITATVFLIWGIVIISSIIVKFKNRHNVEDK